MFHCATMPDRTSPSVLLLERTPLVSLDLVEQIAQLSPRSTIHLVRTLEGAIRTLRAIGGVDLAVLGAPASAFAQVPDWPEAFSAARRVVLTEGSGLPEGAGPGWFVMSRPFAPSVLEGHLAAVRPAAGEAGVAAT